jgi:hypothetical protein
MALKDGWKFQQRPGGLSVKRKKLLLQVQRTGVQEKAITGLILLKLYVQEGARISIGKSMKVSFPPVYLILPISITGWSGSSF